MLLKVYTLLYSVMVMSGYFCTEKPSLNRAKSEEPNVNNAAIVAILMENSDTAKRRFT